MRIRRIVIFIIVLAVAVHAQDPASEAVFYTAIGKLVNIARIVFLGVMNIAVIKNGIDYINDDRDGVKNAGKKIVVGIIIYNTPLALASITGNSQFLNSSIWS